MTPNKLILDTAHFLGVPEDLIDHPDFQGGAAYAEAVGTKNKTLLPIDSYSLQIIWEKKNNRRPDEFGYITVRYHQRKLKDEQEASRHSELHGDG